MVFMIWSAFMKLCLAISLRNTDIGLLIDLNYLINVIINLFAVYFLSEKMYKTLHSNQLSYFLTELMHSRESVKK